MDWPPSRRDVLRAVASGATAAVAGCSLYNPKADMDTPASDPTATTPSPQPMQPFDGAQGPVWDDVDSIERDLYERVNDARVTRDMDKFAWDPDLAYVGKAHCRDMGQRDYYAHESPEGEGPTDRMRAYGLDQTYDTVTEDLIRLPVPDGATKESIADRIFGAWKDSDAHWRQITSTTWDRAGAGVYITEDRVLYGAMMFGKLDDPEP
jgi:uncharacterized protein YkwD